MCVKDSSIPFFKVWAADRKRMSTSFAITFSAFSLAPSLLSWAWMALSIGATSPTLVHLDQCLLDTGFPAFVPFDDLRHKRQRPQAGGGTCKVTSLALVCNFGL